MALLVHALQSMRDTTVLQHLRVAVAPSRSPPKLHVPARKRHKKFENVEELARKYESIISEYRRQGWHIMGEPYAQCARSASIWASTRTRDPYFEILGALRGIIVTPSGGFARRSTFGSRHCVKAWQGAMLVCTQ